MVCPRCIMAVENLLQENGIQPVSVVLGEVTLPKEIGERKMAAIGDGLSKLGFELLDDARSKLINQIKTLLIGKVQEEDIELHFSLQKFIAGHIFKDYSAMSKLFSEVEGITLEQFFILQKIEKIKERLIYNELSLGQIAANLGYSSTQHLSAQFKKLTGMTPGAFRKMGHLHRKAIDSVS